MGRRHVSDFAQTLRWLRTRAGLTQGELAARIRLHGRVPNDSFISRLELGITEPTLATIRSLARALHVRPWMLVVNMSERADFWSGYLALSPAQKREIQRLIQWKLERRS